MASSTVDFYHYTNAASVTAIIKSGMIYESSDGGPDAVLGTGVYGTGIPPAAGKKAIASNNWAQNWFAKERDGHTDYAFKIQIPADEVKEHNVARHIYLHKGRIYLNDYDWELFELLD